MSSAIAFTRDPFSTKAFGPGHVLGAAILVVGTVAIVKALLSRTKPAVGAQPSLPPPSSSSGANERGQYGPTPASPSYAARSPRDAGYHPTVDTPLGPAPDPRVHFDAAGRPMIDTPLGPVPDPRA